MARRKPKQAAFLISYFSEEWRVIFVVDGGDILLTKDVDTIDEAYEWLHSQGVPASAILMAKIRQVHIHNEVFECKI